MEKSSNKLVDLSVAFAIEILNLVKYLKKSLLIDDKQSHSGLFFRNKYNRHTIIAPSESSLKWF